MKQLILLFCLIYLSSTSAADCNVLDCKNLKFSEVQKSWKRVGGYPKTFQKKVKASGMDSFINLSFKEQKPESLPCSLVFMGTFPSKNYKTDFLIRFSKEKKLGIEFIKLPFVNKGQKLALIPNKHIKGLPKGYTLSVSAYIKGKNMALSLLFDECGVYDPDILD